MKAQKTQKYENTRALINLGNFYYYDALAAQNQKTPQNGMIIGTIAVLFLSC
ncbi:hypothetical protein KKD19_06450 [Patescibacteria group bacterium]|nr:hypothetical protein [Patescibacteria group bacterium]